MGVMVHVWDARLGRRVLLVCLCVCVPVLFPGCVALSPGSPQGCLSLRPHPTPPHPHPPCCPGPFHIVDSWDESVTLPCPHTN